jgi:hypothetical protein
MKTKLFKLTLKPSQPATAKCALLLAAVALCWTAAAQPADPGWPRVFKKDGQQLTVYQPQVDYWQGYTNLHFRCAIAVKGVSPQEKFGVAEIDAVTVADLNARVVAVVPATRDVRFANTPEPELTALRQAVEKLNPPGRTTTISLERVIAYLDASKHPVQPAVDLNLDPPKIFSSSTPAILVIFLGKPQFKPVEANRTDLLFALNSNWDILYDAASRIYFLRNGTGWLVTADMFNGPWTPATTLPPSIYSLPANDNWAEARKYLPGKPAKVAPTVFASMEPAELILTDGQPTFLPVKSTQLMRVQNTESIVFLHNGEKQFYFLVAGRWFRAPGISGPWSAASKDLPPDFAQIPDNDPSAFVKACVPGTRDAEDAVLLASIPETTTVNTTTNVTLNVVYSSQPQFVAIPSTTVQYAVNTPNQVFLVDGGYYCCSQGLWFCGTSAIGPWSYCSTVPAAIYTIPPSNPNYNVTYVVVQSSTPTTVTYSQTSGYSGEYVAATGVLMFGAGMLLGAAIANNNSSTYYYYPPPPCTYSYGCGATYSYSSGCYYSSSYAAYGPYGGASYSSGYNSATGTYARSATAYGPYGSATKSQAYNPYTGAAATGGTVNTAYGSASRGAAYNPSTGTAAAGKSVSTAYGSASKGATYNYNTGNGAVGGTKSGAYGSASAVKTTSGGSAATYDTANGQGTVAKTSSGQVYASNGDTVYKKDSNGSWSENTGSGWQSTSQPQSTSTSSTSSSTQQPRTTSTSSSSSSTTSSGSSSTSSRQAQASSVQSQATTARSTGSYENSSTQQQRAQSQGASSSWSQNQQSMEQQAQARERGNQQSQYSSQSRSSGGNYSGGGRYSGGRSGGGRR